MHVEDGVGDLAHEVVGPQLLRDRVHRLEDADDRVTERSYRPWIELVERHDLLNRYVLERGDGSSVWRQACLRNLNKVVNDF